MENDTAFNLTSHGPVVNYSTATMTFGPESIFVPVLFTFIVVGGCIGNSLVICVVIKSQGYKRNTTNLFILNLALADMLFLIFCVPFHAFIYSTINWPFGDFMCKLVHFFQYQSMAISVLLLVAMSTDRMLAIKWPLETRHMRTPKMAFSVVVAIWIVGSAVALPWPIVYTVRTYYEQPWGNSVVCADAWGSRNIRSTYFLILFLFLYLFPLVLISIFSFMMVRELWMVPSIQSTNQNALQSKQKVVRLVCVVVFAFLICWLPFHVQSLWISYGRDTYVRSLGVYYFRIFAHCLSYANACMNPAIYGFCSRNFRNGFKKILQCKYRYVGFYVPNSCTNESHRHRLPNNNNGIRNGREMTNLVNTTWATEAISD